MRCQQFAVERILHLYVTGRRVMWPISLFEPSFHLLDNLPFVLLSKKFGVSRHNHFGKLTFRRAIKVVIETERSDISLSECCSEFYVRSYVSCQTSNVIKDNYILSVRLVINVRKHLHH